MLCERNGIRDRIEDFRHAQMPWLYVAAHKDGRSDTPIETFMPTVGAPSRSPTGSELLAKVMGMGAIVVPKGGGKGSR